MNNEITTLKEPLIAIARHRLASDGDGVTTLVAFYGCTIRCKYCLNPQCHAPDGVWKTVTPIELLNELLIDNLYFMATGGGVTFGGGEPALRSEFIAQFCEIAPTEWNIGMETSLNVERCHLERLLPYINHYWVDVKDFNPEIYKRYTGADNRRVIENLMWLSKQPHARERVTIRVPEIPGFNAPGDIERTVGQITRLGFNDIDKFKYIANEA